MRIIVTESTAAVYVPVNVRKQNVYLNYRKDRVQVLKTSKACIGTVLKPLAEVTKGGWLCKT